MKKPIMSLCAALLLTGSVATSTVFAAVGHSTSISTRIEEEKVKIKPEELPEAIRTKLSSDDFKGWDVSACYMLKESQNYQVDLKKGSDKKVVKFDKDGNVVA